MNETIMKKTAEWLGGNFDEQTKEEIVRLQKENEGELIDAFYRSLEFGTGGLRGIMGVGTNRMNRYTVGMATQGYANYLIKSFPGTSISVAIAHDSRNNSRIFAEIVANIMGANGIKAYLFESLGPTPELSFTIRQLKCQGGVVCTASHNPKEYNGYKPYWSDGGQLVPPHSYSSELVGRRDQLFGENSIGRILKDYNSQTYWISANLHSFFPSPNVPRWLNVSS